MFGQVLRAQGFRLGSSSARETIWGVGVTPAFTHSSGAAKEESSEGRLDTPEESQTFMLSLNPTVNDFVTHGASI